MNKKQAEIVAIQALTWLSGEKTEMESFLTTCGADIKELKQLAGNPEFLAALLDFFLTEDRLIKDFCDAAGLDYQMPMRARAVLPGGEMVNWT